MGTFRLRRGPHDDVIGVEGDEVSDGAESLAEHTGNGVGGPDKTHGQAVERVETIVETDGKILAHVRGNLDVVETVTDVELGSPRTMSGFSLACTHHHDDGTWVGVGGCH